MFSLLQAQKPEECALVYKDLLSKQNQTKISHSWKD